MNCKKCGAILVDDVCPKCGQSETISENRYDELKSLLTSSNEKIVAVLGEESSHQYIQKGKCSNGFSVVTDKRVYFFGKCYDICKNVFGRKGYQKTKEPKVVDLKDVIATGKGKSRNSNWLSCAILNLFLFVMSVFMLSHLINNTGDGPNTEIAIIALLLLLLVPSTFIFVVTGIALFFYTELNAITFQYVGGEIALDELKFTDKEIDYFQQQLRLAKDKATESNNNLGDKNIGEVPNSVVQFASQNSRADELVKLSGLLERGIITQEEFEKMKKDLI